MQRILRPVRLAYQEQVAKWRALVGGRAARDGQVQGVVEERMHRRQLETTSSSLMSASGSETDGGGSTLLWLRLWLCWIDSQMRSLGVLGGPRRLHKVRRVVMLVSSS